jgi:hypothetical protein
MKKKAVTRIGSTWIDLIEMCVERNWPVDEAMDEMMHSRSQSAAAKRALAYKHLSQKGWKQREIASMFGVSKQAVSKAMATA